MKAGDILLGKYEHADDFGCPFCGIKTTTVTDGKYTYSCGFSGRHIGNLNYEVRTPCRKYEAAEVADHPCTCDMPTLLAQGCQCGGT